MTPWTPAPGMAIQHVHDGFKAAVVRCDQPAGKDGTGAIWVILLDGEELFVFEANLQTYWMPIVDEAPKKR